MRHNKKYNFEKIAMEWLEAVRPRVKESTLKNYTYLLMTHILTFWGGFDMRDVTVAAVNAFVGEKMRHGRLKREEGISAKYMQDILSIVKQITNFCEETYGVHNRIRNTRCVRVEKPDARILDKEDKEKLSRELSRNTTRSKLGIMLALYTGLRIGEVCGLKWSDFNEIEGTITVNRTIQRISDGNGGTKLLIGSPKTKASQRTIPLPEFLCDYFKKLKGEPDQPIISEDNSYTEPSALRKIFKKLLELCRIEPIRFHDLRHTFATECVRLKFDTKTLSEILGHSDVSMTLNRYVHSSLEQKRNYMNLLCA